MSFSRICGTCGTTLNKENTGGLKWLQPNCNRCTHSKPTCNHAFKGRAGNVCLLCGFDKNYKEDLIK